MTEPAPHPIRVKKLGHVGLYCRDLDAMADFYTGVLGFQVSDTNERGYVFLRFGSDHHSLVLARMPPEEREKQRGATVIQQIAFEVDDLETVKRIRAYLVAKGARVLGAIKHEGPGGNYTFDLEDPEGNRLQFFSDMDQIGWDGKSRPKEQWRRFTLED